jgi:hypothetical protein
MTTDGRGRAGWQLMAGFFLIGLGVVLLLDRFYIFSFSHAFRLFWPLALIAIGIAKLWSRTSMRRLTPEQDNAPFAS